MPQTSNSSSTPYCSPQTMLQCYSLAIVADMLRATPASPRPSYLAACDQNNPAGARLYEHLMIGAGEIESACTVSARYLPSDLMALTGASLQMLQKLNAARAMWSLCQYLKPLTARPDDVPMANESFLMLDQLRNGIAVFTFEQTQAAGLPTVNPANPYKLVTPNIVSYAQRLFVNYPGINNPYNNRGGGGAN